MPRRWVAVLVGVLVTTLAGCAGESVSTGEPPDNRTTAREFDPADLTAVQSRWWTWAASTPPQTNPVVDPTGAQCANDQPEDVWFLAGSFGDTVERGCHVPAGRPLAGPAVNLWSENRADCAEFMQDATGDVTLDGTPTELHRVDPVEMTFQAKPGNAATNQGGQFRVHGCGLWFSIPALPPGEHVLVIRGSSGTFSLQVTYHLTVAPAT